MQDTIDLKADLANFTGTENYYKASIFSNLKLTDGVKYLAEKAGAYWLIDIIVSYQPKCNKDNMLRDYQIWVLNVKNGKGKVICKRDTDNIAFSQSIPYTDFPLDTIKLIVENNVIMLPQER